MVYNPTYVGFSLIGGSSMLQGEGERLDLGLERLARGHLGEPFALYDSLVTGCCFILDS
jgi:hypothetical protein